MLVSELRSDPDARPQLLAVTQAYAYAVVSPNDKPFVLVLIHGPGPQTHYGFQGFHPLFGTPGISRGT